MYLQRNWDKSITFPKNLFHKILKSAKLKPHKMNLIQECLDDDLDRRLHFCEIMTEFIQTDFLNQILFSDEHFASII